MDRESVDWHGYWPACPTPFTADGALDLESLRALVEWYVGQGMHGIFVNGTSGEWFSQSPEERRLLELRNQGYDWAGIASELNGSAEALRRRLSRALDRVSQELGLDDAP